METRAKALIFGLGTLSSTSSIYLVSNPTLFSSETNRIEKVAEPEKRKTIDGYVEIGLLDDERDSIISDCNDLKDSSEECKQIMEWSYSNGRCNIYILPGDSTIYEHWYFLNFKAGLLDVLKGTSEDFNKLCEEKKSINFHFDTKSKEWKYDGYQKHSWS